LPARRSDLRKSLQTDRRTDGQTDDGRLAIVLAHSWNELKGSPSSKTAIMGCTAGDLTSDVLFCDVGAAWRTTEKELTHTIKSGAQVVRKRL